MIRTHYGKVMYPVGPFVEWLEALVRDAEDEYHYVPPVPGNRHLQMAPASRVAARLGISKESLRQLRRGKWETVEESTVDKCCTNEGSIHISELYPEYWDIAVAGGPRQYLEQLAA